ncbi:Zn(II)2Cys6 transcription factor [Paraphaeosphaeria sporulosa]
MAHEIGTLRALPNGESLFVGSSSGVFFINTVRRAFAHAAAATNRQHTAGDNVNTPLTSLPSPEDCIFGSDQHADAARPQSDGVGELPDHDIAKELLMTYFRTWHPLVPFLHGPSCLAELEQLYAGREGSSGQRRKPRALALAVIFQCLFNIAKLERPDLPPLGNTSFRSEEQLLIPLSSLSLNCDLESIQALLVAQLYFVATMRLQAASSTGGLVLRSIFKSGLHRCPVRYSTFSADERDMRKRVFWSAYTLDRFTSQSLGHPLGIQDSDVDVCQAGMAELHEPVHTIDNIQAGTSPEETLLHLPTNHPQRMSGSTQLDTADTRQTGADESLTSDQENEPPDPDSPLGNNDTGSASQRRHQNQSVQAQFVRYSRLVGRVLETFHKSIHFRSASARDVLLLKADIDAWGNMLPHPSSSRPQPVSPGGASIQPDGLNQDVFFEVARQHLVLLVNRPSLSLKPTSAEFRHAIQICIAASRSIIRVLEAHLNTGGSLFWPGYLSAVWMAGLIMVFACQSRLHGISNATSDIVASLRVLQVITPRWSMAKNCHDVLAWLLESLRKPAASQAPSNVVAELHESGDIPQDNTQFSRGQKRRRCDQPPYSTEGSEYRRVRLSSRNSPWPQWVAPDGDEHTQLFQADTSIIDNIGVNYQSIRPVPSMDPYYFPGTQYSDSNNRFPGSFLYQDPTQSGQQQVPRIAPPFLDGQTDEWNEASRAIPTFNPPPNYDVFDGAMWGSLLGIVEPKS